MENGILAYAFLLATSALGAFFGAYFKKIGENLATHDDIAQLVKQVSAVTAATKQIEAKIDRASRVHERQLDILGKLYRHLHDAQDGLQNMTRHARLEGEKAPEEYAPYVNNAMNAAMEEFLNGKLLIPPTLVQQCETFFSTISEGGLNFNMAREAMIPAGERAKFSKAAAEYAHNQLPMLLQEIYVTARLEIHGEVTIA
jgi:hypothetical protein